MRFVEPPVKMLEKKKVRMNRLGKKESVTNRSIGEDNRDSKDSKG